MFFCGGKLPTYMTFVKYIFCMYVGRLPPGGCCCLVLLVLCMYVGKLPPGGCCCLVLVLVLLVSSLLLLCRLLVVGCWFLMVDF